MEKIFKIFNTHGAVKELCKYDNHACEIIDIIDVNPNKYRVKFANGFETNAYEDELFDENTTEEKANHVTNYLTNCKCQICNSFMVIAEDNAENDSEDYLLCPNCGEKFNRVELNKKEGMFSGNCMTISIPMTQEDYKLNEKAIRDMFGSIFRNQPWDNPDMWTYVGGAESKLVVGWIVAPKSTVIYDVIKKINFIILKPYSYFGEKVLEKLKEKYSFFSRLPLDVQELLVRDIADRLDDLSTKSIQNIDVNEDNINAAICTCIVEKYSTAIS